ncbi:MAG: 2-dehydro-3-deoxy-6-phosphogalactonate aldolase, partial [Lentisphaeria bacterium]|nr:2-dehydro-3-deoxy-6-phosphogalactonate aldolase [Lentisphaeria bacterium]
MKERFEKLLSGCPLVAILRGITPAEVPAVCDVLYENGIRLLEIPLNSPEPLRSIAIAVQHCGDRQMVGAGTVLTAEA